MYCCIPVWGALKGMNLNPVPISIVAIYSLLCYLAQHTILAPFYADAHFSRWFNVFQEHNNECDHINIAPAGYLFSR